jgi:transcriptional regulator with XRE-family HTH domain
VTDRSERWTIVGKAVKAGYTSLGLSQTQFAERVDVSTNTLRAIERGRTEPRPAVIARIELAVGWPPGTIDKVLAGEDEEPPPPGSSPAANDADRIERLEQKVDHLTELLMAALSGDTSQPFVEGARSKQVLGGLPEDFDPDTDEPPSDG